MSNDTAGRIVGYELEKSSFNGHFWQKLPTERFGADEFARAKKAGELSCKLGLKCRLVTLVDEAGAA